MALGLLNPRKITGIDISEGMLELAREKVKKLGLQHKIELLNGDSEAINFNNESFDAVTIAFGVRNFQNLEKGLSEIQRVLRPAGKLVVLEFSKPRIQLVRSLYNMYMKLICSNVGRLVSRNNTAYQYLDESINKFPEGKNFLNILDSLGFKNTYSKTLTLGICTIYCGKK
jgi:demethylmenaquinone methyltransferase/2-methoxy-6-polyprenyl-1,4-benzoquinol methylase